MIGMRTKFCEWHLPTAVRLVGKTQADYASCGLVLCPPESRKSFLFAAVYAAKFSDQGMPANSAWHRPWLPLESLTTGSSTLPAPLL